MLSQAIPAGKVHGIFISFSKGTSMIRQSKVVAYRGKGLCGDRYFLEVEALPRIEGKPNRQVTLISIEAIWEANSQANRRFEPSETRRNIVTSGIDLNQLVDKEFYMGKILMRGTSLCDPCDRPSKLSDKPGFKKLFQNRGGLCAEILLSGVIFVGDDILVKN